MLSKYVVFSPYSTDKYIIFNTLSQSIGVLNDVLYHKLVGSSLDELNNDEILMLQNFGAWVKDENEDVARAKYYFHKTRYSASISYLTLVTTFRCNLACEYCMQRFISNEQIDKDQTTSNISDWINEYVQGSRIKEVSLGIIGGEPLLSFEPATIIIDELKKNGVKVNAQIVTNGTLISEKTIDMLKNNSVNTVQITFDGPRSIHDSVRTFGDAGTFDLLKRAIELLALNNFKISIRINYPKDKADYAILCVNELADLSFKDSVYIYCFEVFDVLVPSMCKPMLTIDNIQMHKKLYSAIIDAGFACPSPMETFICKASLDHSYVIAPDGSLYKCYCHIGSPGHCIGSIDAHGMSIERYTPMTMTIIDSCVGCKFFPICNGDYGCPSSRHKGLAITSKTDTQCAYYTSYDLAMTELLPIYVSYLDLDRE